jgi:nitrogen regulatory protein P-II 1
MVQPDPDEPAVPRRIVMKEIKAVIQPFMLAQVLEALRAIPQMPGVTISHLQGLGGTQGSSQDDLVEPEPKVRLEIVVPETLAEQVARTIETWAHTGNSGDGKVFVYGVEEAIKIRTGQRGEGAL